ncbi:MAG: hypothetical protein CSA11_01915 [Chloroflexi bacterium]|nr:MAG: hypothetical protein CSA11_01915 [Chloroflexota bacterium]
MNINPFIYGRPLTPPEMVGRKKELETVFSRLLTSQSTAVIAPPKSGKTTLLQAINDTATRNQVAGNHFRNRFQQEISSYIDAHTLHDIRTPPPNPALANLAAAYKAAWNNQFDSTALGNLFKALHREKRHFILIVDEFDDFMANETLHTAEFYGSLRSLTSLPSGLTLVIAARQEVGRLNQLTQVINPHGSPYFNIFTELHLGALKSREMAELLALGEGYFTCTDRQFIANVSGQHPYLAQAAASSLWEAHENKLAESKRYQAAANNFYVQTEAHFADVWRSLSDGGRKGITAVALQQFPAFGG